MTNFGLYVWSFEVSPLFDNVGMFGETSHSLVKMFFFVFKLFFQRFSSNFQNPLLLHFTFLLFVTAMACDDLDLAMLKSALEQVQEIVKLGALESGDDKKKKTRGEPEAEDDLLKLESEKKTLVPREVKHNPGHTQCEGKHRHRLISAKQSPEWW